MFTIRSLRAALVVRQASALVVALTIAMTAALTVSPTAASAAPTAERLTAVDRQAIERTIRQQLAAFASGDADRAFDFASPDIQRMFGSPDRFLAMVRDHYEAVYRAAGVRFDRLDRLDGRWVETVRITDDGGRVWRAQFTMRRQPNKVWKVGGCELEQTDAVTI